MHPARSAPGQKKKKKEKNMLAHAHLDGTEYACVRASA